MKQLRAFLRRLFPPLYSEIEKGHGRLETRSIRVAKAVKRFNFPAAKQVAEITRVRTVKNETSVEVAYIITSLSLKRAAPEKLLELNRKHWHVENKLHYVKDVSYNEDRRYHRKNPAIFSAFRNLALNIFRLLGKAFVPTYQRFFVMNTDACARALGIA